MKFRSVTEGNVIIFPEIILQMQMQHVSVWVEYLLMPPPIIIVFALL